MADRIVVMNHGVIEQVGTPLEIYREPQTAFVADFVGSMNFLPGLPDRAGSRPGQPAGAVLPRERARAREPGDGRDPPGGHPGARGRRRAPRTRSRRRSRRSTSSARTCAPGSRPRRSATNLCTRDFSINLVRRMALAEGRRLPVRLPRERLRIYPGDAAPDMASSAGRALARPRIKPTARPRRFPAARGHGGDRAVPPDHARLAALGDAVEVVRDLRAPLGGDRGRGVRRQRLAAARDARGVRRPGRQAGQFRPDADRTHPPAGDRDHRARPGRRVRAHAPARCLRGGRAAAAPEPLFARRARHSRSRPGICSTILVRPGSSIGLQNYRAYFQTPALAHLDLAQPASSPR